MNELHRLDIQTLKQLKDNARKANYYDAFSYAKEIYRREPHNSSNFDDIICYAIYAAQWQEAIKYCLIGLKNPKNYLNSLDGLSHSYYHIGEYDKCKEYGLKALEYRNADCLKNVALPQLPTVKPRAGKKLISFSLFGQDPFYIEPAILNAELVSRIYPGWICRFYIDNSVPFSAIERLLKNGAEVLLCDESLQHIPKTMWRFLALDDNNVAYSVFRDADSVISPREFNAVNDWIESGKYFHSMRDNGSHTDLILAGLWGAMAGVLPPIRQMIEDFIENNRLDKRFADQDFLRVSVWKYMIQSLYANDSIFNFLGNTYPFTGEKHVENFIGRAEFTSQMQVQGNWRDGTKLKYALYSRVDPLIRENFDKYMLLEKERFIFEYEAEACNGRFTARIPKRYAQGVKNKDTRLDIVIQGN